MSTNYKMLVKRASQDKSSIKSCYIVDFMATRMSKPQFERMQAVNECLKDWEYRPADEVDFTWWNRCFKKLTPSAIRRAEFRCDYYGNVEEL